MRRGRIFIIIALILLIGIVVLTLVFRSYLFPSSGSTAANTQQTTVQIFIAGQNIPQGETITEDVLATIEIPQDKLVSVMITTDQRAELVGKVARYPIDQGVVITRPMISEGSLATGGPAEASQIPQGLTAVTIPTARLTSVAYGVSDGAHVDVNACFLFIDVDPSFQSELPNHISVLTAPANVPPADMAGVTLGVYPPDAPQPQGRTEVESAFQQGIYVQPSENQRPRLVCQMMLQNVVVLKMGNFPLPTTTPAQVDQQAQATNSQNPQAAPSTPDVVTLVVTPQDSVTLTYLIYSGAEITMTLRNAADESRVATEAATLQFLLSQYNIPVPAKLPYAMQPRIDELVTPFLPNDVVTIPPAQ